MPQKFCGTYDGKGHRISGIRIFSRSSSYCIAGYEGIFGKIGSSATVSGIILDDTRITGHCYIGGIAGHNDGIISDCHVTDKVNIHAITDGSTIFGGIAGVNYDGTISGCTSAVSITSVSVEVTNAPIPYSYKMGKRVGGIAGSNYSTLKDCLFLGTTLEGEEAVGAIAGVNGSSVENSYYTSTAFAGADGNGLALRDDADNSAFLALMAARNTALTAVERTPALNTAVDLTLTGRTLYKDGDWNTLCLPFDLVLEGSPLDGDNVQAMMLNKETSGLSGSTLTLNFDAAPATIPAGTPFIIKWATKDAPADNLVNPVFSGVTVKTSNPTSINLSDGTVTFNGIFDPIKRYANDKRFLYLGAENKLYWPNADMQLGAFRAFFELGASNASEFVLNYGEGETTGISPPSISPKGENTEASPWEGLVGVPWYTLDGRKLDSKPTQKGLYIHGNKKIVIK